ncbi:MULTISPECIES: anti-sigma factor [unclassified Nocardia]|uniref:anti-sigma factor n=1 Tax=unclassified Nocardia TaxID=2637762 RepID=UPI00278C74F8|nr:MULTISPECIES: anti-sigma factor [unclassified Nocardia]
MPDRSPDTDLLDLAYPYALDALSDEERAAVEERVRTADAAAATAFRDSVRDIRETLAALTVVDAHPAPDHVEASVQAALDRQLSAAAPAARTWPVRWLAAAAVLILAIGVGAFLAVDRAQQRDSGAVTAQRVLAEPDARQTRASVTGGGDIVVTTSARLDAAAVSFDAVPAAPPNHTYQLWLIPEGGQPVSAGVLDALPAADDPAVVPLDHADLLALSVEPTGGSDQPTTDPVVAVPLD